MNTTLIYDTMTELPVFMNNSVLKKYIYKLVDNPGQRRIYLKIPRENITTTAEQYKLDMNAPKPIKAIELTGRSRDFVFFTLHF